MVTLSLISRRVITRSPAVSSPKQKGHGSGTKSPNWLGGGAFDADYVEDLRSKEGLGELYISFQEPPGPYPVCIYRIVALGAGKDIGKLYVCGG